MSQVQDVLGYTRTSRDVPELEAVLGPMVPESQVQDVLGYTWTSRDVPELEAVLGPRVPGPRCPGIYQDIPGCPELEAVLGPSVPGPRCPGIYQDIPGCSRAGGSVRSQSPRSKMSWDIPGHPGMSQSWRQC